MYPYISLRGSKIFMTGIGIVSAFITFLIVTHYLTKRYLQSFWKLFYWLPGTIILVYLLGSYTQFLLSTKHFLPGSGAELLSILSPYGYRFHFAGILIGLTISVILFMRKVKTKENRKIWADIFFFAFGLCLIPLGIFLLLGDNFIGLSTSSWIGVKSLHSESLWNKFDAVYPIGIFLSIFSLLSVFIIWIKRHLNKKVFGYGFLGFAILIFATNIVLMLQQYPRYFVFSLGNVTFDIKQHVSFFVIMICLYTHNKLSKENKKILSNNN